MLDFDVRWKSSIEDNGALSDGTITDSLFSRARLEVSSNCCLSIMVLIEGSYLMVLGGFALQHQHIYEPICMTNRDVRFAISGRNQQISIKP